MQTLLCDSLLALAISISLLPSLLLQHFNKNEPLDFTQLQVSLAYLHMVVAGVSGTLSSPDLPINTCTSPPEVERPVTATTAAYRRGKERQSPETQLESASFHHCCFYLVLTLFTRTGSRQISEDSEILLS